MTNKLDTENAVDVPQDAERLAFARFLAREATEAGNAIIDEWESEYHLLIWAAQTWAALGDCDTAIKIIESAKSDDFRDIALLHCAYSKITSGDLHAAERIAERIESIYSKVDGLAKIIAARVRSGNPVDIEQITKLAEDTKRDEPLETIAISCIEMNDFATATQIAGYITDTTRKTEIYKRLVKAQLSSGDQAGAQASVDAISEATSDDDSELYLADLVSIQACVGDFDRAWRSVAAIKAADRRVWPISEIVKEYAVRGNQKAALDAVARIHPFVEETVGIEDKISAWNGLGRAQRLVGDVEEADKSFVSAIRLTEELTETWKISNLMNTTLIRAKAGDLIGAKQTARHIQRFDCLISVSRHVAEYQTSEGDMVGARVTLLQARDLLQDFDDSEKQAEMLASLVTNLLECGSTEEALITAAQIRVSNKRCAAFCEVAIVQAKSGDFSHAQTTLLNAVEAAEQPCDSYTILGLIIAQAEVGDFSGAEKTARRLKHVIREEAEAHRHYLQQRDDYGVHSIDDFYLSQVNYHFAETAFKLGRYGELFAGRIG